MSLVSTADLAERAARYQVLDQITEPIWIFDIDASRVHWANGAALQIWQADSINELLHRDMSGDMSDVVARRLRQYQADFERQEVRFNEQWTLYPHGMPTTLHVVFSGHRLPDGRMAMICQGRTQPDVAPESLRSVQALLHTSVMITLYDGNGHPLYRNPAARESVNQLSETHADRFVNQQDYRHFMSALRRRGSVTHTVLVQTRQGVSWHEVSARSCLDAVTGGQACVVSEVDVSDLKRTEARANHLALHDALTGLPNRSFVTRNFVHTLQDALQRGMEAALIFMDLDHFKDINDTLGHAAGDELLVQMAKRLRRVVREGDLIARLGGDEFLILVTSTNIERDADAVAHRVLRTVDRPETIAGAEVRVTATLGISRFPADGSDVETLLRNADLAMYSAKDRGRNCIAYYAADMGTAARTRMMLEAELRGALERGELEVFYQPRLSVATCRIVGAEALLRWRHPQLGLVPPAQFIPLCERSELINQVGRFVIDRVAEQQVAWDALGFPLRLSLNLSPRQFSDPSLIDTIQAALTRSGCRADQLELEITESLLIGNADRAVAILRSLEQFGLRIALDDFGTGYSNLSYLQRYPIRTLKIDRSFIHGLGSDRPLTELIVAMGKLMKLSVVAEGVETAAQFDWIASQCIDECQGYLFSPPLTASDFLALLQRNAGQPLQPKP